MKKIDPQIYAAIIAGLLVIANTVVSFVLNNRINNVTEELKQISKPTIIIDSPSKDEETGRIITVKGRVKIGTGQIPDGYKILVGHKSITETNVAIHADRETHVLSDKSYLVDNVYLGGEEKGIGENFEIIVLLVNQDTIDSLQLKDGDNPLGEMPKYLAKSVTRVRRVR